MMKSKFRVVVIFRKEMEKKFKLMHVLWQVLHNWYFTKYPWCGEGRNIGQHEGSSLTGLFKKLSSATS